MFRKGLFTVLLTMALVLGIVSASFADNGKGKSHWKFKGHGNSKVSQLNDVSSHWAEQSIRAMCSLGIVQGYPDFTFRPNIPVTKYEAVMMISKASGFDGTFDTRRSWDNQVPQWMRECLDFAVDEGILTETEAEGFKGGEPAKRVEVAVWANRAMNLGQYDQFSFQDMDEIPLYARPYVGGMFRNHYMVGYPGNVFQPNKPVTRAELAAILYRIMQGQPYDDHEDGQNGSEVRISSLNPADGSGNVDTATRELVARFNVDVRAIDNLQRVKEGVRVRNVTDSDDVDVDGVSIDGRDLAIKLYDYLESDKTYRVTIDRDILEARDSGRNFEGISGSQWEFRTTDRNSYGELRISSLNPADGSNNVPTDTRNLVARFNTEIRAVYDLQRVKEGILVRNITDNRDVDLDWVSINGRDLSIQLKDSLESNKTYRVTMESNLIEATGSGRNFEGISGSQWEFGTIQGIKVLELTPRNGAGDVDGVNTKVLKARFNRDIQVIPGRDLLGAVKVYNRSHNTYLDIFKVEVNQDTLLITLDDYLTRGDAFEVTIKPDYLEAEQDGENFAGIDGIDWRFTTRS